MISLLYFISYSCEKTTDQLMLGVNVAVGCLTEWKHGVVAVDPPSTYSLLFGRTKYCNLSGKLTRYYHNANINRKNAFPCVHC